MTIDNHISTVSMVATNRLFIYKLQKKTTTYHANISSRV